MTDTLSYNQRRVLSFIAENGETHSYDIAKNCGMAISTAYSIINKLIEKKYVKVIERRATKNAPARNIIQLDSITRGEVKLMNDDIELDRVVLRRFNDEYTLTLYFIKNSKKKRRIVKELNGKHLDTQAVRAQCYKIIEELEQTYVVDRQSISQEISSYLDKVAT